MLSPVGPPSGRVPSLSVTWEVCHRSNPSSVLPHDLGKNSQGRKPLELVNALRGECPNPTQFPYQPSAIGIVPDSAYLVLSHCCSVHPKSSTHCPRLYPYQSSIPTLQDSLARILLHRVRGCNPYTLHVYTQLNPTSNFGKSLHLCILIIKDGEIYLHVGFFLKSSTSSGASWSIWPVRSGWHQGHCQ